MTISLLATPARAYAPEVPRAIARAALPGESGRLLGVEAAAAVDARLAAEEADPEAAAASHVHFAPAPGDASTTAFGSAPGALAEAYDALALGFAGGDPAAIVRSTAALAIAVADLADPFRTAAPGRAGPQGARARFADRVDPSELIVVGPSGGGTPVGSVSEARTAGASLAARSAALRDSVEMLAGAGRDAELAVLRHALIGSALGLAQDLVAGARQASDRVLLDAASRGTVLVLPNPARAHAHLAFRATASGTAHIRVLSADGRRVAEFDELVQGGAVAIALDARLPRGLAPGAYLVQVTAPGASGVARFVRIAR